MKLFNTNNINIIQECRIMFGVTLPSLLILVIGLVETHGLQPHLYADDTHIYSYCRPGDNEQQQSRVPASVNDVGLWMSNRLQLNTAKTEVLWLASVRRQHQISEDLLMVGLD